MTRFLLFTIFLFPMFSFGQIPFYYKFHEVKGEIYTTDSTVVSMEIRNRWNLQLKNCNNDQLESFLKVLMATRLSRKYLEHLITTSANITIDISDKVGIMKKDGLYRLIAGMTGSSEDQADSLIMDQTSNLKGKRKDDPVLVYAENTISIFGGSIHYCHEPYKLDSTNTILFDFENNRTIEAFSFDTIQIEPIMNPDQLYTDWKELYYFAGIHEIFHTTAANIDVQLEVGGDVEYGAYKLENQAFQARSKVNRRIKKIARKMQQSARDQCVVD